MVLEQEIPVRPEFYLQQNKRQPFLVFDDFLQFALFPLKDMIRIKTDADGQASHPEPVINELLHHKQKKTYETHSKQFYHLLKSSVGIGVTETILSISFSALPALPAPYPGTMR